MIDRPIGIGRSGFSVLKRISHVCIGIHVIEIRLCLFRCRNCDWMGCGWPRRRVGSVDGNQTSENEDGQVGKW